MNEEEEDRGKPVVEKPSRAPSVDFQRSATSAAIEEEIDKWFDEFRGGPVARNVDAWNHISGAVGGLKARIRKILGEN